MDVSEISKDRELLASIFSAQSKQHPGGMDEIRLRFSLHTLILEKQAQNTFMTGSKRDKWLHMYVKTAPTRRFPLYNLFFWGGEDVYHSPSEILSLTQKNKAILNWICCCNTCRRNCKSCVPQLQEVLARNARALSKVVFMSLMFEPSIA